MKRLAFKLGGILLIAVCLFSVYLLWFDALPRLSDFWRGVCILPFAVLTLAYTLFAGGVFYFGILGRYND